MIGQMATAIALPEFKVAYYSFLRLSSAHYDCLPDVSITRTCKNDASNPKKKRKPLQPLKGVKSLRYM